MAGENQFLIRLRTDVVLLDLPGPKMGTQVRGPAQWVTGQTVDGTRYSYQTNASTKRLWTLPLVMLSAAQKVSLESFFYDTVQGPSIAWVYRHTNLASYTARFVQDRLEFTRRNAALWDVTLQIETTDIVS